ncbi:MAG: hypothetical protein JSS61_00100 [Verrucomicrobia bacterium]|nr:hypothetical protein [Verrucomicrobiota bacterium]
MSSIARVDSRLADSLLFSTRPQEVQDKIDEVFNRLARKGTSDWGHNGAIGFYHLLDFKEQDVIAQRIEKTRKKVMYFIDLGAGQFRWVDDVHQFLRSKYSGSKQHFHVIGVTAEGETNDRQQVDGNVTTHKITGFKLENLLESFEKLDLKLENSVQHIVCSWTLQHLVDPLGTLEQAYNLLDRGGFLFGTGFVAANPYSEQKYGFGKLLSQAFGIHSYIVRRGTENADSFALIRDPDAVSFSRAKDNFTYNPSSPLFETAGRYDSFAACYAHINPKEVRESCDADFGGKFYGFTSYVLEQLIGNEPKWIRGSGNAFCCLPLFGTGGGLRERYLDAGNYQVDLEENRGKGPKSDIEIHREIAELKLRLGIF